MLDHFRKAFNILPHSWLPKRLHFKRSIFQAGSSSPLLFGVALILLLLVLKEVDESYELGKKKGCMNNLSFIGDPKSYSENVSGPWSKQCKFSGQNHFWLSG